MNVEKKEITIRDLVEDYEDLQESGVFGYSGSLNIRPPYQREFIYTPDQQAAVINTVSRGFPLGILYWAHNSDDTFEVIDGQQRTLSICRYVSGGMSHGGLYFHNLPKDKQEQILDYKLTVYFCSGTDSEELEWFKTINIAGEKLADQELRNAVYSGTWTSDAKRYFSKTGCPAYDIGSSYVTGSPIRQEFLETAIKWISDDYIEGYMAEHQHDQNANALWNYFQSVVTWVDTTFTNKRTKHMRGVNWGYLYNTYKDDIVNTDDIEDEVASLILDDDVTKKSGIYLFIFTRNAKYLNVRSFSDSMKQKVYEQQEGVCVSCEEKFDIEGMEADHITPWIDGGRTNEDNCQMLCKSFNRVKSSG